VNWQELRSFQLIPLGSGVTVEMLIGALVIVGVTLIAARLLRAWMATMRRKAGVNASPVLYIAERVGFYAILAAGVLGAFNAVGFNLSSLAIFAGALGVGVGLGLQAVVRNFLSGVTLLLDGSLGPGDFIELEDGLAGEVLEVGSRATRLVTNDNVDVMVPNAYLLDHRVVNWTRGGATRRIRIAFSVAHGVDKELVRKAGLEAAAAVAFTLPEQGERRTQVWLAGFGDHGLNFELVVWPSLDAVKRPGAMRAAYNWAIEDALRRHGIEIPFPQMDLRVRSLFGQEGEAGLSALHPTAHVAPAHNVEAQPQAGTPDAGAEDEAPRLASRRT